MPDRRSSTRAHAGPTTGSGTAGGDLYAVLGVTPTAGEQEIKRAYRARARELHPDVSAAPGAQTAFAALSAAYEVLSDPARRAEYDARRSGGVRPGFGHDAPAHEAHFNWSNIAGRSVRVQTAEQVSDLGELYDLFYRDHHQARQSRSKTAPSPAPPPAGASSATDAPVADSREPRASRTGRARKPGKAS